MLLVAVVALSLGTVARWKLHQMSAPGHVTTVNGPAAPPEFNLKRLTFELSGSVGEWGMLVYVDVNGHPHRVELTTLLWSHSETTTLTEVSGSVSAQVHGGEIGRRMLVNGVVRAEQSATHQDAHIFCIVKSARASIA
jgi:MmpS family membrane protein